jgi:hypothetical protein
MLVFQLVSAKKLAAMAEMFGVYLESTSLKKWNSSSILTLKNHGKNFIRWSSQVKFFIRVLDFLTRLLVSSVAR